MKIKGNENKILDIRKEIFRQIPSPLNHKSGCRETTVEAEKV
jgi:hypothetical protein